MADGPFVVTHLTANSKEGSIISACLPEPMLLNDSWGVVIDSNALNKLKWVNTNGTSSKSPSRGDRIGTIYFDVRDTLFYNR